MTDLFRRYSEEKIKDFSQIQGHLVWVPMLQSDSAGEIPFSDKPDPRLPQLWDKAKEISQQYRRTLNLNCDAWDVYLVYPRGVQWTADDPPQPVFWMHQLSRPDTGADPKMKLDPKRLDGAVGHELGLVHN